MYLMHIITSVITLPSAQHTARMAWCTARAICKVKFYFSSFAKLLQIIFFPFSLLVVWTSQNLWIQSKWLGLFWVVIIFSPLGIFPLLFKCVPPLGNRRSHCGPLCCLSKKWERIVWQYFCNGFIVFELSFEATSIKMVLKCLSNSVAFYHDYAAFKQWRTARGWNTAFPFYRWV